MFDNPSNRTTEEDHKRIKKDLDSDWRKLVVIKLTDGLLSSAGDTAVKLSLRAFDALHLASALELQKAVSNPVKFSSYEAHP